MNLGGAWGARNGYWLSLLLGLTSPVLLTGLNLPRRTPQPGVSAQNVADAQLADEANGVDWLAYGRTYDGKRFSPIDQISFADIGDLKVDWYTELPTNVGVGSTPLVAGGVMYFADSSNIVTAVNAKTGTILWTYDSRAPEKAGDRMTPAVVHAGRGVALWKGRVYLATAAGRLVALDAKSGRESWSVNTFVPEELLHVVGVPITFHGKVLIGDAGSEDGNTRGYVTAYDAETGAQTWRFYTLPSGEFTYDPEFNAIYIGTANSIFALDADTGQYRRHYQARPADPGDSDSVGSMILADLKIKGREVKALMQASRNGLFYVIDRATGKLISAKPYVKVIRAGKTDVTIGAGGAHDWQPISYNTNTGLVYIPESEPSEVSRTPAASLLAWDPVHQSRAWEVSLNTNWSPGTLTTAGNLVFEGRTDGVLYAYDATDGRVVWKYNLGLGIASPPMSYCINGLQYIALLVGWGGGFAADEGAATVNPGSQYNLQPRWLVAFSLQGSADYRPH